MPPDAPDPGSPADWIRHASSDLALARAPQSPEILLESLCFHAQQAVEKSLKAVLLSRRIAFPRTHNIRTLLDLLPSELEMPDPVIQAAALTDYAVSARYPVEIESPTEQEYREAIGLAVAVLAWAKQLIDSV